MFPNAQPNPSMTDESFYVFQSFAMEISSVISWLSMALQGYQEFSNTPGFVWPFAKYNISGLGDQ